MNIRHCSCCGEFSSIHNDKCVNCGANNKKEVLPGIIAGIDSPACESYSGTLYSEVRAEIGSISPSIVSALGG